MPDHGHDVTPWTHLNRVPLCQATLSIGLYLLLKVQFQRYFVSQTSPALNSRSRSLSQKEADSPERESSGATSLNEAGQVVGYGQLENEDEGFTDIHGFPWKDDGNPDTADMKNIGQLEEPPREPSLVHPTTSEPDRVASRTMRQLAGTPTPGRPTRGGQDQIIAANW